MQSRAAVRDHLGADSKKSDSPRKISPMTVAAAHKISDNFVPFIIHFLSDYLYMIRSFSFVLLTTVR